MGKQGALDRIRANSRIAEQAGRSCFHPGGSVNEVRNYVGRHGVAQFTSDEQTAFNTLSPAVFWVNFERGWMAAAAESSAGMAADRG